MEKALWQNKIIRYAEEAPEQLLAHPQNWRIHPAQQQQALAGVLDDVGWIAPIIVNAATQHVIDGHLRISLALRQQLPTVPVIYVQLTEAEEAEALATFDPLSAMAATDAAQLDALLREVSTSNDAVQQMLANLAEQAGVVPLLPEAGAGGDEFDATPEDGPTRAQPGDLWLIDGGKHRLLVGDCTDPANVARLMQGERAAAVLTDPPYGMNLDTDWSDAVGQLTSTSRRHQTKGNTYDRVIGDDKPFDPSHIFEFFGYCKEMFLWGADYYAERIPDRNEGSWLVWDKRKESQAEAIGSEFELCWSKARHKRRMLRHDWFGFLSSGNSAEARNREHPNQKPTTLLIDIIDQWVAGDLLVDLYLGSGTTMIAAHRTGRRCYGMEIAPRYVDVILRRAEAEGLNVERVES